MTQPRHSFLAAAALASDAATKARKLRESRDPAYLAMLDAALARAKSEGPQKQRASQWKYR